MKTVIKSFWTLGFVLLSSILAAQQLQVSVTSGGSPVCNLDGSLSATIGGGVPPYTYTWYLYPDMNTVIGTSSTLNSLDLGQYVVNVTDAAGTTGAGWGYLSHVINAHASSTSAVCPLTDGAIDLTVTSGAAPFSFLWSNGATTEDISNLAPGDYEVIITDANGCALNSASSDSVLHGLTVWSQSNIQANESSTFANCLNGTATVNPTGGIPPYSYAWSNQQTTQTATNLVAYNYYSCDITDAQGCMGYGYVYIQSNTNLTSGTTVTPEHCNDADGTATVSAAGGALPYSYSWDNGQTVPSISGLVQGYYISYVTDANGCVSTAYASVNRTSPINLSFSTSPASCPTGTNGSATVNVSGGTAPFSYVWSSNPVQTTQTASNLSAGFYSVSVSDAAGCTKYGAVNVNDNSNLNVTLSHSNYVCGSALLGSASANVMGNFPPYTYLWSNGATTSSISNLSEGSYSVVVTDASGCQRNKHVYVDELSPMYLSFSTVSPSCTYFSDGEATVNVSGGVAPYTFAWGNGQTTQTATGLSVGYVGVTVTDANGCTKSGYKQLYSSNTIGCSVDITGKVFHDVNNDCADNFEPGIANVMVHASGQGYKFTDANGNFSFNGLQTGTYTVHQYPALYAMQTCPLSDITLSLPNVGDQGVANFADDFQDIQDLRISATNINPPRPGFDFMQNVAVENEGTISMSNFFTVKHDPNLVFASSSVLPVSYDAATQEIVFDYNNLAQGHNTSVNITYTVPASVPLSTVLDFDFAVDPIATDNTVWDNQYHLQAVTVGSYDPNDKQVFPKGLGLPGYISYADSVLEYTIRFQNTGTFPATFVTIKDQISPNLRISSFEPGVSSHPYTVTISETNEVAFHFDNINLADSGSNMAASQGFVKFRIHTKQGLAQYDEIRNSAAIYFDFNAPVITNETLNTIKTVVKNDDLTLGSLLLVPNPANSSVNVQAQGISEPSVKVELVDMLGRVLSSNSIQTFNGNANTQFNTENLPSGMYHVKIEGEKTSISRKLVVNH